MLNEIFSILIALSVVISTFIDKYGISVVSEMTLRMKRSEKEPIRGNIKMIIKNPFAAARLCACLALVLWSSIGSSFYSVLSLNFYEHSNNILMSSPNRKNDSVNGFFYTATYLTKRLGVSKLRDSLNKPSLLIHNVMIIYSL